MLKNKLKSKINWKHIKGLVATGMKLVDIERKYNGLVTAEEISRKKANWKKQDYYAKDSKYQTPQYKEWRAAVLKKDNYRCVVCGRGRPARLQADHIHSWCRYPELRFSVDNGQTLCIPCHKRTPNYGRKALNYVCSFEANAEWIKQEKERIKVARLKKRLKSL